MLKNHTVTFTISVEGPIDLFEPEEVEEELMHWVKRVDSHLHDVERALATEKVHNNDRHIDWQVSDLIKFEQSWEAYDD